MADPRELARQAFSMLQSALASSEARAEKLNEELGRKPVSKDKLANQVSVLTHRLESVEEECARWKRESEQLEEVLENERAKFDALKKKLDIAESGPDKLTKKEINYWRSNAEKFDAQIAGYKTRIATLQHELQERQRLIEAAESKSAADDVVPQLNQALEAVEAERSALRDQLAELTGVLSTRESEREGLQSELRALTERLSATETKERELGVELERMRSDNSELRASVQRSEQALDELCRARDALQIRIGELEGVAAENSELRATVERSERALDELSGARETLQTRITELESVGRENTDLRSAVERAEADLRALRSSRDELGRQVADLDRLHNDNRELRSSLQLSEAALHELRREREDQAQELAELNRQIEEQRAAREEQERQSELLSNAIEETRERSAALEGELETTRRTLFDREHQLDEVSARQPGSPELEQELKQARDELEALRAAAGNSEAELAELRDAREALAAELAELHRRVERDAAQVEEADRRRDAAIAELETIREREATLRSEIDSVKLATHDQSEAAQALNDAIAAAERRASEAEAVAAELRTELSEEKEYSENLSELANSRQDEIVKLQDAVDEARERLDDALWRLKKAKHFERLVARRKHLINALIEALRGKNRAMVALKAGLDSLRTHKAVSEETHQKLRMRIEAMKNELNASKDQIRTYEAELAAASEKQSGDSSGEMSALQERLTTQAELIQSLEDELKGARVFKRDAAEKDGEVVQLHEELETKNTIIARLQSDLDEQQRKLAKLRGSESEINRLKAGANKDRSTIDILERENAELRTRIEKVGQDGPAGAEVSSEREAELLAKIAELTESANKWKRKYEFLSTEAPAAYQSQAAGKP